MADPRRRSTTIGAFVTQVYLPDVAGNRLRSYADWTGVWRRCHQLSVACPTCRWIPAGPSSRFPADTSPEANLDQFQADQQSFDDPFFANGVKESVKHAWYRGGRGALHPYDGETEPEYTDFNDDEQILLGKIPNFPTMPAPRSGRLANVLCHVRGGARADPALDQLAGSDRGDRATISAAELPLSALHSTIGRHAARAVRCAVQYEAL